MQKFSGAWCAEAVAKVPAGASTVNLRLFTGTTRAKQVHQETRSFSVPVDPKALERAVLELRALHPLDRAFVDLAESGSGAKGFVEMAEVDARSVAQSIQAGPTESAAYIAVVRTNVEMTLGYKELAYRSFETIEALTGENMTLAARVAKLEAEASTKQAAEEAAPPKSQARQMVDQTVENVLLPMLKQAAGDALGLGGGAGKSGPDALAAAFMQLAPAEREALGARLVDLHQAAGSK